MATESNKGESLLSDSSPFALLVNAANAQSREAKAAATAASSNEALRAYEVALAAQAQENQRNRAGADWREALQREAIERDALERQALERQLLQHRAALFGMGGGGAFQGLPPQEAEYLQQLRLEALVQQRRQETLAQLALAQEMGMSQDMQALANAQQLRQASLLRQEMLLAAGMGAGGYPQGLEQFGMHLSSGNEESLLIQQYLEERERQQNLAHASLRPPTTSSSQFGGSEGKSPPETTSNSSSKEQTGMESHSSSKGETTVPKGPANLGNDVGTTVLPCRARGMPVDHTAKTAYFVVPWDIKHGTELVCSYYACRNSGIKFRYCAHCKLPVAKRNFFIRHKHKGKIPSYKLPEGGLEEEDISEENPKDSDGQTQADVQAEATIETKPNKAEDKPKLVEADQKPEVIEKVESVQKTIVTDLSAKTKPEVKSKQDSQVDAPKMLAMLLANGAKEVAVGSDNGSTTSDEPLSVLEFEQRAKSRKTRWEQLLLKRMHSSDVTPSWVQEVLAVSDMDTPLDGEEFGGGISKDELHGEAIKAIVSKTQKTSSITNTPPTQPVKDTEAVNKEKDLSRSNKSGFARKEHIGRPTSGTASEKTSLVGSPETAAPSKLTQGKDGAASEKPHVEQLKRDEGMDRSDDHSDSGCTTSDDSVDLRASKKAKIA